MCPLRRMGLLSRREKLCVRAILTQAVVTVQMFLEYRWQGRPAPGEGIPSFGIVFAPWYSRNLPRAGA